MSVTEEFSYLLISYVQGFPVSATMESKLNNLCIYGLPVSATDKAMHEKLSNFICLWFTCECHKGITTLNILHVYEAKLSIYIRYLWFTCECHVVLILWFELSYVDDVIKNRPSANVIKLFILPSILMQNQPSLTFAVRAQCPLWVLLSRLLRYPQMLDLPENAGQLSFFH